MAANPNEIENGMQIEETQPDVKEEFEGKKAKSLIELLALMDDYSPVIPDTVTDYYLAKSGFQCNDVRIKRLLGLATQKFISDIATDALQCKSQTSTKDRTNSKNPRDQKRAVLTMEDLSSALAEHGVNSRKPEYFL
ncbi:Transcription initiation factor TFIID subunit 10 [Lobulomyces angularis]|nr:Transcription initiation factor TFIID subunit 10 [Lobulomyces angularis]